jgi:large subunit ribosomal protein L10
MNRDQKAAAIAEIAAHIDKSHAIFAVDYRGISVPQVAELRSKLRDADATFKVVKNSLTERAADDAGAATLKDYLTGPTALTFVRGDAATAARAIADYARATQLLPFKGGLMDGAVLEVEQIRALSRLPSREVLYGQLVGVVAAPISGVVRTLSALIGGLASALGQVRDKKESGEIPAGEPPAAAEAEAPAADEAGAETEAGEPAGDAEAPAAAEAAAPGAEAPAAAEESSAEEPASEAESSATEADAEVPAEEPAPADPDAAEEPVAEAERDDSVGAAEASGEEQTAPAEPADNDDNQAGASAQAEPDAAADANPTKED